MSISKDKTGVLINMNKTLKKELEILAQKDRRSLTSYITNILEDHINQHKKS